MKRFKYIISQFMRFKRVPIYLFLLLGGLTTSGIAEQAYETITPVIVKGNKFVFKDSGKRFNVKGICYQPVDNQDPLSDDKYDAFVSDFNNYMKKANINAIRVYQVEPDKGHDKIMNFLAENNIHVQIGMVNNYVAITTFEDSDTHTSGLGPFRVNWAKDYTKKVADAFSKYNNVMSYSVSNELILPPCTQNKKEGEAGKNSSYWAPSYVKEVVKTLKAHIASKASDTYRSDIPIGVVLRDTPPETMQGMQYYIAGTSAERVDFLGYNCERWAQGDEQGRINAYLLFCQQLQQYGVDDKPISFYVPIVFTEYSMETAQDDYPDTKYIRKYKQVPYMFGVKELSDGSTSLNMNDFICGGFVFRFLKKNQNFGMYIGQSGGTLTSNSNSDNAALATEYAAISDAGEVPAEVTIPTTIEIPADNPFNHPLPSVSSGSDVVRNYHYNLGRSGNLNASTISASSVTAGLKAKSTSGTQVISQVGLALNGFSEYIVKIKESDGSEYYAVIFYQDGQVHDIEKLDAIPADGAILQTGLYHLFYHTGSGSTGAYVFPGLTENKDIYKPIHATDTPELLNNSKLRLKAKKDKKTDKSTFTLTVNNIAFSEEAISELADGAMVLIPGTDGPVEAQKLKLHEKRGRLTVVLENNPLAAISHGSTLPIFIISNNEDYAIWDAAILK